MAMTPLVRYKNINLNNFKNFLKMYPYIVDEILWDKSYDSFDFTQINANLGRYKQTAYQFASQVGIENKGNNNFEVNEYLFKMNDNWLKKYLQFWALTYYAPNPHVNGDEEAKIIWVDLCEKVLEQENLEIDYYQYFHDNINENIDVSNPNNTGNPDTLRNALIENGLFLKIKDDRRTIYIEKQDEVKVRMKISYIRENYPIPINYKDKSIFFNRYSFENFSKMYPYKIIRDISVDLDNSFSIDNLFFDDKYIIEKRINKALKSGKHIILTGPPGTGKSKLAKEICDQFNVGYRMTTAISDWSTYETIGGYKMDKSGDLFFDEGIFLSCFKDKFSEVKNEWLIIDEMNRADIDKAFGVFFSVLTGDNVKLSFKDNQNNNIEILNEVNHTNVSGTESHQYIIPRDWRLIGTINTLDKASLFEMSYAFMRRFAFIPISIPKNINKTLIEKYLDIWNIENINVGTMSLSQGLAELWININKYRPIGPAIFKDIASYVCDEDDWISAVIMYVLPQFDGIDESDIKAFINDLELSNITMTAVGVNELYEFVEDFLGVSSR